MPTLSRNSVALVTASSAGLGAATALALASTGVRVVINYLSSREKADQLLEDLSRSASVVKTENDSHGPPELLPRFMSIQADVSNRAELTRLVNESAAAMGRLDVVVSNQGWTKMRNFYDLDDNLDEGDWDKCYNVNVKSHLFLFHAARKYLEATEGSFITTASVAGVIPSGSSLAYSVTKAAQIHLVKALAMIAGPKIRVNCVSPGILLTDWGNQFPAAKLEAATNKSSLKRLATVEDVAQQILCFVNCRSITGSNAIIDAGYSL